jgi:hypothetical protein
LRRDPRRRRGAAGDRIVFAGVEVSRVSPGMSTSTRSHARLLGHARRARKYLLPAGSRVPGRAASVTVEAAVA